MKNAKSSAGSTVSGKKFNRCTIQIRKLPLEAFRLPRDGRKWKQSALSRYGLLLEISTFANGDGSFLSPDAKINFSPSAKKLLRHRTNGTLYRLANDLRELGLLSWHRNNHYGRRFYEIDLSEKQVRFSGENTSHIREENTSHIRKNTSHHEHVITPPTTMPYPSLESLPSGGSPGSPPLGPILWRDQGTPSSSSSGKAPAKKADDDSAASVPSDARIELLSKKAAVILVGRGKERDFVEVTLDFIKTRAVETPATAQYFLTGFERLEQNPEEKNQMLDRVEKLRAQRHNGTPVQPDSEVEQSERSESPTNSEPATPAPISPDAPTTATWKAEQLVYYDKYFRFGASSEECEHGWELVRRKFVRLKNGTGEFRDAEKGQAFLEYILRLDDEKRTRDAKRARTNERRREQRREQRQRPPTDAPEKEKP